VEHIMAKKPRNTSKNEPSEGGGVQRLIIELDASPRMAAAAEAAMADGGGAEIPASVAALVAGAGGSLVADFAPVAIPHVEGQDAMEAGLDTASRFSVSFDAGEQTVIVVAEGDAAVAEKLMAAPEVQAVYADCPIEPCLICPGSPPLGNAGDVARLLCTRRLVEAGMDGTGVLLAIVDTGINHAHLVSRGVTLTRDAARSWVPAAGMTPFDAPVGHGTMCAFDAAIAAPRATFLDIQLLRAGGAFTSFLSEAVRAYAHLQRIMRAPRRPGEARSLVVNNSWGMFHPSWDFPVGHPGNYSDNPNHPFNRSVAALEALGADILFAAGNCGANCPDGRCQGVTANAIYGANGHSAVLCVAGVDTTKRRVGYSSQGPGRLTRNKPDICGYTHFSGSGVYAADGGTSAACPVVAGVVAAVRTKRPHQPGNPAASPHAIRELVRSTAEDLGTAGFDFDHGFGVVNGCAIADRLAPRPIAPIPDLCRRFPDLCRPGPVPIDFCRRFPQLCGPGPVPPGPIPPGPFPPGPLPPGPLPPGPRLETDHADSAAEDPGLTLVLARMWEMGYQEGRVAAAPSDRKGGCGCE
jgi:subtilisin family serine protease